MNINQYRQILKALTKSKDIEAYNSFINLDIEIN